MRKITWLSVTVFVASFCLVGLVGSTILRLSQAQAAAAEQRRIEDKALDAVYGDKPVKLDIDGQKPITIDGEAGPVALKAEVVRFVGVHWEDTRSAPELVSYMYYSSDLRRVNGGDVLLIRRGVVKGQVLPAAAFTLQIKDDHLRLVPCDNPGRNCTVIVVQPGEGLIIPVKQLR